MGVKFYSRQTNVSKSCSNVFADRVTSVLLANK